MIGVDTSFLIGLTVKEHVAHGARWQLFEKEIVGGEASMAVAPQVLAEFCHIVTDSRRFEKPLSMPEALELCEQWWNARECRPVVVDAEVGALFLTWMYEHKLGRKRLLDTLLAASYYCAGVQRLGRPRIGATLRVTGSSSSSDWANERMDNGPFHPSC